MVLGGIRLEFAILAAVGGVKIGGKSGKSILSVCCDVSRASRDRDVLFYAKTEINCYYFSKIRSVLGCCGGFIEQVESSNYIVGPHKKDTTRVQ